MDDQKAIGEVDADDLQHDTAIVLADPQQTLIKITLGGESAGLSRVIHGSNDVRLTEPPFPGRLFRAD